MQTALEKLPADRFPSAAEFARALGDPSFRVASAGSASQHVSRAKLPRTFRVLPWAIAGVASAAALLLAFFRPREATPGLAPTFVTLALDDVGLAGFGNNMFAISSDGRHVALVLAGSGNAGLAIRSLDSLGVRVLARTRGATYPFWSPNGRTIGYFADDSLKTIDVATGEIRSLCAALTARGGTWSADDVILFSSENAGIQRTGPAGGRCATLPISDAQGVAHARPYFFPDGRHFIITTDTKVWMGDLDSDSLATLAELARSEAVLAAPDYLLFKSPSSSRVQAQRIDVGARKLVGDPVEILVGVPNPGGRTGVAASTNGVLVANVRRESMRDAAQIVATEGSRLLEVDRDDGRVVERMPPEATFRGLRLAHDGRRFAIGGWNIKIGELSTQSRDVRIAGNPEPGRESSFFPLWAPTDSAIAFLRDAARTRAVDVVDVRSGMVRTLFSAPADSRRVQLMDWSRDGQRIAFNRSPASGPIAEAWEYDVRSDSSTRMFQSAASVWDLRYSPDGAFIAYQSIASGESDVYIRPRGNGAPVRVSAGGGQWPRWRADGGELYFVAQDGAVMAVPVHLGASLGVGTPAVAVAANALGGLRPIEFDAAPDGKRFVFYANEKVDELTLVMNWWAMLRDRKQ